MEIRPGWGAISPEHVEMTQQPPEQNEDQHRAEASATQLLCPVPGREAAEKFAHCGAPRSLERGLDIERATGCDA